MPTSPGRRTPRPKPWISLLLDAHFLLVSRIREGFCFVTTDTTHILSNRDRMRESCRCFIRSSGLVNQMDYVILHKYEQMRWEDS